MFESELRAALTKDRRKDFACNELGCRMLGQHVGAIHGFVRCFLHFQASQCKGQSVGLPVRINGILCAYNGRIFLDAFPHLYKRVCPSVGPSVRPSVGHTRVEFPRNGPNSNKIASGIRKYAI